MKSFLKRGAVLVAPVIAVTGASGQAENASNPLAAVNNTDIRIQGISAQAGDKGDFFIDGAYMVTPRLKFKYELHYVSTDVTGTRHNDFEKLVLKPIYFPTDGKLSDGWGYRTAIGFDYIVDLGKVSEGTGIGTDQFAPLVGVAFSHQPTGWALIPLLQHFTDVGGGTDISQTAARLIALKPFGDGYWLKMDAKVPYDWETDSWPASAELQLGRNIGQGTAVYADAMFGIGSDRLFDWGLGLGLRFNY